MPILHLGVTVIPYVDKGKKGKASTVTTGQVAGWLEDEYHVMETFVDLHGHEIGDAFAESLLGGMETLVMNADKLGSGASIDSVLHNVYGTAESKTEVLFRKMIDMKELDGLIPGVPTQASLDGTSQRLKKRKRKTARPSFDDTGLYKNNFKAWVE